MKVVIIDGQGGALGARLVKEILSELESLELSVVGTNAIATAAMLKAGAKSGATGENPVAVACRRADVIIGPVGIVIADSLMGEVTEKMALSVARADAVRILIPMNKCDNLVAGISEPNTGELIADVIVKLKALMLDKGL
ncbi:MAG: DUF3842 family protein [Clostridia bacterium]|nr:DUF3842 family protein [Clostridia bacterium]